MAKQYLLPNEGTYFKANLHAHTTYSDGKLTPQQMKTLYKNNGYQILAYTDHNVLNYFNELDEENFLVLCGYEVDAYTNKSYGGFEKTCHLNAIARNPKKAILVNKPEYNVDAINETINILNENDFIVNYNHPSWSAEESKDYLNLKGLTAMEIINYGCEVESNDGDSRSHYDIMLKHGMKLFCIATDDNHNKEVIDTNSKSDSCGGYTMIKAPSLTYSNIIKAIDNGEFYCSTGVLIYNYYIEDNKICIDCSPSSGVYIKTNNIGVGFYKTSNNDDITHAEFDLSLLRGTEKYIRCEISNTQRQMAFTNPYYL